MDVIIIAASKNKELREITQYAIDTCNKYTDANIYIIETKKRHQYEGAEVIEFIENDFNYNRTVNYGLSKTKSDIVGIFNNDVEFTEGWAGPVKEALQKYDSVSPRCKHYNRSSHGLKEGYKLHVNLNGWAIVINRKILDKIGGFDESVNFWRSDDLYAEQLKKHGIKHALVSESIVNHLGSKTLNTLSGNKRKKYTVDQYDIYKESDVHNYTFSVIMASYLGDYVNAAKHRKKKFKRAVNSVLNSTFKDFELIIVSDGCDDTVRLYKKHFSKHENVKCYKIPKQPYMSGNVRQVGLMKATGKYVIYLDSDDMYGKNHLQFVNDNFSGDWVYFNDVFYAGEKWSVKKVRLELGVAGTSSICHKRLLKVTWEGCDGYGHDWTFIEQLMNFEGKHIGTGRYLICHTPGNFDYNGGY